jgi:hypothetical protein
MPGCWIGHRYEAIRGIIRQLRDVSIAICNGKKVSARSVKNPLLAIFKTKGPVARSLDERCSLAGGPSYCKRIRIVRLSSPSE